MTLLAVALGGSIGAVLRLVADGALRARRPGPLPVATIAINISGSFVLGLLTGFAATHHAPADLLPALGTGGCGGYTTFSTASFETVRLLQQGDRRTALLNAAVTAVGAVGAAVLGIHLGAVS